MIDLILIFISIFIAVCGQILMKKGMLQVGFIQLSHFGEKFWAMMLNPWVILGLVFYALSAVLWLIILSRKDLSFVYPLVSLGYVVVLFFSAVIFKEQVSLLRWVGTLVIMLGIFLISRS
jgi:drug/metabolite transporter (DMT)-like permease